ncbi:MAG: cysteine desulfurase family protein [Planctomycetota bacterium JB042]
MTIYLDHNATTPLDPRVLDAMRPFLLEEFGNPSSPHRMGCAAAGAVEAARAEVAAALAADPREIVFTSGATEANNLALLGAAEGGAAVGRDRHVVTVRTEHRAVLDPCRELERRGFRLTVLPVDGEGRLDPDALAAAVTDRTLLVSIMHANNETGLLHPLRELSAIARARGALFHTDATQSFGKLPLDVDEDGLDLVSFSAHKLCGPKGVGGLFVRRRRPRVRLAPRQLGGGHERGHRSGTLNVPGIVGLGRAAALAVSERAAERERVARLRDRLEAALLSIDGAVRNGPASPRLPGTTNVAFGALDAPALLRRMPALCASTAAACTSAVVQPSHVLGAMGLDDARIGASIRFSLGRTTTEEDVDRAAALVEEAVAALRRGEAAG